jgi:hypothetical protein
MTSVITDQSNIKDAEFVVVRHARVRLPWISRASTRGANIDHQHRCAGDHDGQNPKTGRRMAQIRGGMKNEPKKHLHVTSGEKAGKEQNK